MHSRFNFDEILADKAFEVEHLQVGQVAGLPDGSDVELTANDGGEAGDGLYVTSLAAGSSIVTGFTTASERSQAALSIVRASLERALA